LIVILVLCVSLPRRSLLWDPHGCLIISKLVGHTSSIQEVIVNDDRNQIITLSTDKQIKIWDCRTSRCIQTVQDHEQYRPENRITAMAWYGLFCTQRTHTQFLDVCCEYKL
jgi:WD40 repeat protein